MFLVQVDDGSLSSADLLQRSPSKRRWIFDSLKTYALFHSGVSLNKADRIVMFVCKICDVVIVSS